MAKEVIKRGPWLEPWLNEDWSEPDSTRLWLCGMATEEYWYIKSAYSIRVCGSTHKQPGTIETMACDGSWQWRDEDTYRFTDYANWLKSFNSPVVYIWIERWDK